MAFSKHGKGKLAAKAKPKPVKKSKWAGTRASVPRDPMPVVGTYRLRVLDCEEGTNPGTGSESSKTHFEIVDLEGKQAKSTHDKGDSVIVIFVTNGKGGESGRSRVKSMVMATLGFDDEDAYDEHDPDGECIDACHGAANKYSKKGNPLVGRLVDCEVKRGNPVNADNPDGDYYREYEWAPVDEDEQGEADEDDSDEDDDDSDEEE